MAHNSGSLPKCSGIFERLPTEDGVDVKGDEGKVPDFFYRLGSRRWLDISFQPSAFGI